MAVAANVANDADCRLLITRVFDASREIVFKALTDPEQMVRWIGPRSFKAVITECNVRPGGRYRIEMHQEKAVYPVSGVYREVSAPERLIYSWAWEQPDGKLGHETLVTVTLKALGGKTELTLRHEIFESKESADNHGIGWAGSFDKLADVLAGKPGRV
jgi:uncharacterized protein YndB with AHSA1/START domain